MKTNFKLLFSQYFLMGLLALTISCNKDDDNPVTLTVTDKEGNIYGTITIGNQVWMAENLKTTKYNDGDDIPLVTDNTAWTDLTTPGYCWYDNNQATYGGTYGALYNWFVVETGKLCPTGWHVPTDEEWKQLETTLGMSSLVIDDIGWRGTTEGSKLAGNASLWKDGILDSEPAFGTSGFKALPAGYRSFNDGGCYHIGISTTWWCSDEYSTTHAWFRTIRDTYSDVYRDFYGDKNNGKSVRCLKD